MRKLTTGKVKIGKTYVGKGLSTFFVAEIGLNHNGDVKTAKELIREAKSAGANAVKFQKRNHHEIFTESMLMEPYTGPNSYGKSYGEHRSALEFTFDEYLELLNFAKSLDILFFASVWDESSVDFMSDLGTDAYKVASADASNIRLINKIIATKKPILISTGMSTEVELESIVKFVRSRTNKFIFFHSTSLYPANYENLHLSFMNKLSKMSGKNPIGYSGHESDIFPSVAAIILGASIVERHITLDKMAKGSDHAASLLPSEFSQLVDHARNFEKVLGTPTKPELSEPLLAMRRKLGKSLYYSTDLQEGHRVDAKDLKLLSPGNGISPLREQEFIGKRLTRSVKRQEPLSEDDF